MKRFKTLEIENHRDRLLNLLCDLKQSENPTYIYQKSKTDKYSKNVFVETNYAACFKAKRKSLFNSYIYMLLSNSVLSVTNIVSPEVQNLGVDDYNHVLETFYTEFIQTYINNTDNVRISRGEENVSDILDEETFGKLTEWERTCNKECPRSHPADYKRWLDFVVSAFDHGSRLSREELSSWLRCERGWSEYLDSQIEEMADLYEYGMDILNASEDGGM